jgi:hypothetical protein
VLVRGSVVGADVLWDGQAPLEARWALVKPNQRGFGDSLWAEGEDFQADADYLIALVEEGDHLVGFSYGGGSGSTGGTGSGSSPSCPSASTNSGRSPGTPAAAPADTVTTAGTSKPHGRPTSPSRRRPPRHARSPHQPPPAAQRNALTALLPYGVIGRPDPEPDCESIPTTSLTAP